MYVLKGRSIIQRKCAIKLI